MGHLKNYHVGFPESLFYITTVLNIWKYHFPQFLSIGLFDLIFCFKTNGLLLFMYFRLVPFLVPLILGPGEAVLSGDGLHHAKLLTIHPTVRKHIPPPPAGSSSSVNTKVNFITNVSACILAIWHQKAEAKTPPLSSGTNLPLHWALEGSPGPSLGARSCPGAGCPPPHPPLFWAEPSLMGQPRAVGKFLLTEAKMLIQNFK